MAEPKVTKRSIKDYRPAEINPNKGTVRGVPAIVDSLSYNGAGRSILVDRDGEAIAGSHTIQAAMDAGFTDVYEIETDGKTLIAVKRTDLDLTTDAKARALQIADNRTTILGYDQDDDLVVQMLASIAAEDSKLVQGAGFSDFDVKALMEGFETPDGDLWGDALANLPDGDRAPFQQMTFTLHDLQAEQVKRAIQIAGAMLPPNDLNENSNGNALAFICEAFITEHGQS